MQQNKLLKKAIDSEKKISDLEKELQSVKQDMQKARSESKQMREHMLKTESQERRNNLILDGCPQHQRESREDCLNIVYKVLEDHMEIDSPRNIRIDRCHRMPAQNKQKTMPIIFKVRYYPDHEKIWEARRKLKGSGIFISEDYPSEIKKRRQILQPIMRKAQQEGHRSSLSYDKLYIAGKMYTAETTDKSH